MSQKAIDCYLMDTAMNCTDGGFAFVFLAGEIILKQQLFLDHIFQNKQTKQKPYDWSKMVHNPGLSNRVRKQCCFTVTIVYIYINCK